MFFFGGGGSGGLGFRVGGLGLHSSIAVEQGNGKANGNSFTS